MSIVIEEYPKATVSDMSIVIEDNTSIITVNNILNGRVSHSEVFLSLSRYEPSPEDALSFVRACFETGLDVTDLNCIYPSRRSGYWIMYIDAWNLLLDHGVDFRSKCVVFQAIRTYEPKIFQTLIDRGLRPDDIAKFDAILAACEDKMSFDMAWCLYCFFSKSQYFYRLEDTLRKQSKFWPKIRIFLIYIEQRKKEDIDSKRRMM